METNEQHYTYVIYKTNSQPKLYIYVVHEFMALRVHTRRVLKCTKRKISIKQVNFLQSILIKFYKRIQ